MTKKIIYNDIRYYQVEDFEDYYISKCGKVLSSKCNKFKLLKKRLMPSGYFSVVLTKNNKPYFRLVHRLLAYNFIPNGSEHPYLVHINNIKTDNSLFNLEWSDEIEYVKRNYNNISKGKSHAHYNKKGNKHPVSKRVKQINRYTGEVIKVWGCVYDIEKELLIKHRYIRECCTGLRDSIDDFLWEYE